MKIRIIGRSISFGDIWRTDTNWFSRTFSFLGDKSKIWYWETCHKNNNKIALARFCEVAFVSAMSGNGSLKKKLAPWRNPVWTDFLKSAKHTKNTNKKMQNNSLVFKAY